MPNVKGKKFPYTKAGMKAAKAYEKKPSSKKSLLKRVVK
tara:strand:- start:779 stop:895 length:117 start_codon:yes stop_codon:yes gene_type:complete